jgi:hypothetical protein
MPAARVRWSLSLGHVPDSMSHWLGGDESGASPVQVDHDDNEIAGGPITGAAILTEPLHHNGPSIDCHASIKPPASSRSMQKRIGERHSMKCSDSALA